MRRNCDGSVAASAGSRVAGPCSGSPRPAAFRPRARRSIAISSRRARLGKRREPDRGQPRNGARAAARDVDRGAKRMARRIHRHRRVRPGVDSDLALGVEARARALPTVERPRRAIAGDRALWTFAVANALEHDPLFALDELDHGLFRRRAPADTGRRQPGTRGSRRCSPALAASRADGFRALDASRHACGERAISRLPDCVGAGARHRRDPAAPNPAWAAVGISVSFFAVAAFSVNMYSLPLDVFGGSRAAFAVSMLTASAGAAGLAVALPRPTHRPARLRARDRDRFGHAACRVRPVMVDEGRAVKQRLKRWIFGLLGKDPDAVVVTFASGPPELCRRMADEVRALVPDRRHFVATHENWPELRRELRRYRIGLAPVMLTREPNALRRAAFRLAPRKILAYNSRLERHHLRFDLASLLFARGVPLDRIYLRPWWWPWPKRERTVIPTAVRRIEGRPCSPERRRVAVLSPYFPYPLSHGGAVRILHLLREIAREFDVELFAFTEMGNAPSGAELSPVLEFCARVVLVEKPRYREPQWSTILPPRGA